MRRTAPFVLWLAVLLMAVLAAAAQAQVQVSVVENAQDADQLVLDLVLDQAQGVAGVDLLLSAPAEVFAGPPGWELVDLAGSAAVNDQVAGQLRLAFAAAEGYAQGRGVLLRLTLPLDCSGVDGDGSVVPFTLSEVAVYGVDPGGDVVPVDFQTHDAQLTTCVRVPAAEQSFSTLKAAYR